MPLSKKKKKKKKGLDFESISLFHIFLPKSCRSQKKKRSALRIDILFTYFPPKIMVISKKKASLRIELRFIYFRCQLQVFSKKKVRTQNQAPIRQFLSPNSLIYRLPVQLPQFFPKVPRHYWDFQSFASQSTKCQFVSRP